MTENSTHDLLIAYLFNELRPSERNCLEHYLISSADLQQDMLVFQQTLAQLKMPLLEPKTATVKLLLDYAAS
ncbi:MAG: hypothetical protein ACK417_02300 [Bacteroidia bacterium]